MRGATQMQEYSYEGGESSLELMPTSIGQEDCRPGHSFGPGERNTYLIHYLKLRTLKRIAIPYR